MPKLRTPTYVGLVAERFLLGEAGSVRAGGRERSENVGISSIKRSENLRRRKPKVSWATQLGPGLVGPKARRKRVVDGQQVNIPALAYCRWRDASLLTERFSAIVVLEHKTAPR